MPIQLVCDKCGQKLKVRDEFAGQVVACPACAHEQVAPAAAGETAVRAGPRKPAPRRPRDDEDDDRDDRRPPRRATSTSGKAVMSLVFGLLSPCLPLIAPILSIVLAVLSFGQISRSGGRVGGKGLAIAGIVTSIVLTLIAVPVWAIGVGLFVPAFQNVFDATAQRQSQNNLKQIGLALHNYHDAWGRLPPAVVRNKNGEPLYSWRVLILPYIEQDNLYKQFKLDEPWDSPTNRPLSAAVIRTYASRSGDTSGLTSYQVFNGPGTMFGDPQGTRFAEVTDGTSNTIMVVEAGEPVPWARPGDIPFQPGQPVGPLKGPFAGGINVLMGDASVRRLKRDIPETTLRLLITANDGQVVPADW